MLISSDELVLISGRSWRRYRERLDPLATLVLGPSSLADLIVCRYAGRPPIPGTSS